ncbi:hypothetical protein WJX75_008005 [Coccomyxa subellipsoidea]|uniref:RING-type E3 ubiquitin transferase n=1 Tax=Coccomyxa subellipsoidea TaxID=248742 RepID=A0ABR2YD69_9CHLO
MDINLSSLEAETRCPVCLGIVKHCRLVSGCMHRFCADCIEKWLRVANEPSCPQCREQMQSRRDCKRDIRFDRLLKLLYTNIRSYEAQMYHPKADMLQEAKKTGLALATAAAAQRAKRAAARPPPARRTPASAPQATAGGVHAAADGNSPYAVIAPSNTLSKVDPVQRGQQRSAQKADKLRADSPSPNPGPAASAPAAVAREPALMAKQAKHSKRAASTARSSGQPKKPRTGQTPTRTPTPEPSKPQPPPANRADTERGAMAEARKLASKAAIAAAAEAAQTAPMVEVHLHRDEAMAFLIKDADIMLLCPAGLTFLQLSQLLTQRHASLRGRQVYYRLRGSAQQSQAAEQVSEVETVADVASRLADCRQDLHIEFVATAD